MELFINNAETVLSSGLLADQTQMTVVNGDVFPIPAGNYFMLTLVDEYGHFEIVRVTARSGNTLTVVRGEENTTPRDWPANTTIVSARATAGTLTRLRNGEEHEHDDRYYQKPEIDTQVSGLDGRIVELDETKSDIGHNHDDRYYLKGDVYNKDEINDTIDELNSAIEAAKTVNINHNHDDRYYLKDETYNKDEVDNYVTELNNEIEQKADAAHNHDDLYYRKGDVYNKNNVDILISEHNHDQRYYTKPEINELVGSTVPSKIYAGSIVCGETWCGAPIEGSSQDVSDSRTVITNRPPSFSDIQPAGTLWIDFIAQDFWVCVDHDRVGSIWRGRDGTLVSSETEPIPEETAQQDIVFAGSIFSGEIWCGAPVEEQRDNPDEHIAIYAGLVTCGEAWSGANIDDRRFDINEDSVVTCGSFVCSETWCGAPENAKSDDIEPSAVIYAGIITCGETWCGAPIK